MKLWKSLLITTCASVLHAEPNCQNGDPTKGWGNATPNDEAVCAKLYYENLLKTSPEKFFEACKLNDCEVKWNDIMTNAAASNVQGKDHDPNKTLRDNNTSTAWVAKWEKQPNLTIAIRIKAQVTAGFSIANGYQKSPEDFDKNGAIKKITVYHDAVTEANKVGTFEIGKEENTQYYPFDKLQKGAGRFFFRIEDVHEAEAGTVCASELRVWGN